ncbi:MAG: PASTA domain-containing protein [Nitriliruptorales bacterium]|nr:PASTA domain-containing protein [Nitriliruptorales bacterium]
MSGVALPRVLSDRFELGRELGRGGMATVWRARDLELGRQVAVKLLHPEHAANPAFVDRFQREARAAASVTHPNLVGLHDQGREGDAVFLVMELVEGQSLRDLLRAEETLSPGEVVAVLGPAADGLAAVHAQGLVHRDVKPENILITSTGQVKVADFGLARVAASTSVTMGRDHVLGSLHYVAPEAVRGRPVDARADVYALGVVAWECLVGRPPIEGDNPATVATLHATTDIPAPSANGAAPDLDAAILAATARDPDARLPDAAAFARRVREGVTAAAVPLTVLDRSGDEAAGRVPRASSGTAMIPLDATETVVTGTAGPEPSGSGRRRVSRRTLVRAAGATTLTAVGGWLLWDRLFAPVRDIPDLAGVQEVDARAALAASGFDVHTIRREYNSEVAAGGVISWNPAGQAREGSVVELVVSVGARQVEVADVTGRTLAEAEAMLRAQGLTVTSREVHGQLEPGLVLQTSPEAGTTIDATTPVRIDVSLGPEPVTVPDVVGATESEAVKLLSDAGLVPEFAERVHDDEVPVDVVISQDPPGEAEAFKGDTVTLVVSRGPAPVPMPNVRGKTESEATSQLEALGLVVTATPIGTGPSEVLDQSPAPGVEVRRGDNVTIFVARPG